MTTDTFDTLVLPRDLVQVTTVLVVPGFIPANLDADDLVGLGSAVESEAVRTPVLVNYRFPSHIVTVDPPRATFATAPPTLKSVIALEGSIRGFISDFVGRKGVTAVGLNALYRRRHPEGLAPSDIVSQLIHPAALNAVGGTNGPDINLEVIAESDFSDRVQMGIQPSRTDDLDAMFFTFNFHFDTGNDSRRLDVALDSMSAAIERSDQMIHEFFGDLDTLPSARSTHG